MYGVQGAALRGRPTPAATLAKEDEVHQILQSGQRSMIEYSVLILNWRLDNAKSPAAMLQEKNARTPHTLRVADVVRTYPR